MSSSKLRQSKSNNESHSKFLSNDLTRTMKPADFKNQEKFRDLGEEDMVELLTLMEAELQAKDLLLKAILTGEAGTALPLSNLLNDDEHATLVEEKREEEDEEVWLGEPSAHLTHVVAYHQVVREQMQSIVDAVQAQHKQALGQLTEEQQKHAADRAQGDDVTYMLEKERERLQNQIEVEQAKYAQLEKERDELLKVVEAERREQYNTFNNLMQDCKALARELVQQSSKFEQYQKEIDKEKQKNKLLSELMVKETQRLKEKIKSYETEVSDSHVLEQKRLELEAKLQASDKKNKETFRQLDDERKRNSKLQYQLNQLHKRLSLDFNEQHQQGSDEDVMLVQDVVERPVRQSNKMTIQLNSSAYPDNERVAPALKLSQGKMATVCNVPRSLNTQSQAQPAISSSFKRHSYEDKGSVQDQPHNLEDTMMKRNSYESLNDPRNERHAAIKPKHNSYEEVRNLGTNRMTSADDRRVLPPAPPRRVSSLNEKPPIVKVPLHLQPHKSNSVTSRTTSNTTGVEIIKLLVCCEYGWKYTEGGDFVQVCPFFDLVTLLELDRAQSWSDVTHLIDVTLEQHCPLFRQHNGMLKFVTYELGTLKWSSDNLPVHCTLVEALNDNTQDIVVKLKPSDEKNMYNLAYSSMMPLNSLEEISRIVSLEKRIMVSVNEVIEGRHFAASFANWIKLCEESKGRTCYIASIDEGENISTLTKRLIDAGVIQSEEREKNTSGGVSHVLTLNVDYTDKVGLTPLVFDWLSGNDTELCVDKSVTVLAFATNNKVNTPGQWTYRMFKIFSLPWLLPDLAHRWLCQKVSQYPTYFANELHMLETAQWLADVYQSLRKSFYKIELLSKLPDIRLYLNAPLDDLDDLAYWMEELWVGRITPCVEESVVYRTTSASESQQQVLVLATLKALYEKSIRPGCPVSLSV